MLLVSKDAGDRAGMAIANGFFAFGEFEPAVPGHLLNRVGGARFLDGWDSTTRIPRGHRPEREASVTRTAE